MVSGAGQLARVTARPVWQSHPTTETASARREGPTHAGDVAVCWPARRERPASSDTGIAAAFLPLEWAAVSIDGSPSALRAVLRVEQEAAAGSLGNGGVGRRLGGLAGQIARRCPSGSLESGSGTDGSASLALPGSETGLIIARWRIPKGWGLFRAR